MACNNRYLLLFLATGALALVLTTAVSAAAQTYSVINTFESTNGAQPMAAVVFDQTGNLYGTTFTGGLGNGVVFELSPNGSGGWTEIVLYQFGSRSSDGANPYGPLIFDSKGNLYGTTQKGGVYGAGTVFELSPSGSKWTETILHQFGSVTNDGQNPYAGVTMDANGDLYGTTFAGGSVNACSFNGNPSSCGTVFALTLNKTSKSLTSRYSYSVIHNFSNVNDGYFPVAGVTLGPSGYLYGEAAYGATYEQGLLFELIPNGNGTWTEQGLHIWGYVHDGRPDGGYPYSTVIFDSNNIMYGTTNVGGTHGDLGTVYRFTENANGTWAENNLHGFGNPPEGSYPESALLDVDGDLYGTTIEGGNDGFGTVYQLIGSDNYSYVQLYNFTGGSDGATPTGSLVMDAQGNLYGTAPYGGDQTVCTGGTVKGCGVVYKISFPQTLTLKESKEEGQQR